MKNPLFSLLILLGFALSAQNTMSPEKLWELGRVGLEDAREDQVLYGVSYYDTEANSGVRELYLADLESGSTRQLTEFGKGSIQLPSHRRPDRIRSGRSAS